jgi:hypothetical protein
MVVRHCVNDHRTNKSVKKSGLLLYEYYLFGLTQRVLITTITENELNK